ncbi:MAG: PilZ domain-containing protein [Anaerolineales bacterium]|nr:PilZ domain-containing protein [Anaerolineales bacterium]
MEIHRWIKKDSIFHISPALEGENWFASKVVEVGNTSFFIVNPKIPEGFFPASPGAFLRVRVPSSEGLFQLVCAVLSETQGAEGRIELDFPKEVVHLERRAYPRLPIKLETRYAEIRDTHAGLSFSKSTSLDISGGGILMETHRNCPQETLLRVKFQIPLGQMEEELNLTGRIVRSVPGEGARKSQVGVEFIDISPRQQESLIQYILDHSKNPRLQS